MGDRPNQQPSAGWGGRRRGLALLGFVYLGPIQALLGHRPLTLAQWLPVLVAPVLLFAAGETRKAVIRRHRAAGPERTGHKTLRRRTAAG